MAQFDLYRLAGAGGLFVDCQSDLLRDLTTRLVLPLVAEGTVYIFPSRLNPMLEIDGVGYVLMAHLPATLPRSVLRNPVGTARAHRLAITSAIDMLTGGV
ncbi:CcdB family protein [Sphingomonas sp. BIUV-7]|uniref:Toxin CcdB n=1 Tax=Sphingomonas natans TaxID=3063330 RepID=A0ABT8Y673_9SPHN|nr:CcdB family protein [Sphingomonas sp. BIUV-7]MDO6413815.1 CcdB family protein [Sphingomonas sp. BIUV-7]